MTTTLIASTLVAMLSGVLGWQWGKKVAYNEELEALRNQRTELVSKASVNEYFLRTRYMMVCEVMKNMQPAERVALVTNPDFATYESLDDKIGSPNDQLVSMGIAASCGFIGFTTVLGASYLLAKKRYS